MGIQYTDMIYQRDKYKKRYEEEKIKNASLEKDIQKMRGRQDDLEKELNRLKRKESASRKKHELESPFALTTNISRMMSILEVNINDLDTETLCKIMRGEN